MGASRIEVLRGRSVGGSADGGADGDGGGGPEGRKFFLTFSGVGPGGPGTIVRRQQSLASGTAKSLLVAGAGCP